MRRFCIFVLYTLLGLVLLAGITATAGLYYLVVVVDCPEMEESHIASILGRESPVYYRHGEEKIGVLFQGIHRQYLSYDKIPVNFINAIVAAEDDRFFQHHGVDLKGIVRAFIVNLRAGRIVQGGSTITQQTAKNLFKRESRSYKAKLKELLYALRLEYRYSKEKILEFYVNQFFVSGNGHGLGVAARYYFDKDPENLTLLESAFIAGSVKRPNYYNPFTKKTPEAVQRARARAEARAGYVLGKMLEGGMISKAQYEKARASTIVFKRGRMAYALNTIMDLVKDGLADPLVVAALEEHGISNVATSGVRIYTSVDREIQEKALYALRRHLSKLDVRLRGYRREMVQEEYGEQGYRGDTELRPGAFMFGTVRRIEQDQDGVRIYVDLAKKRLGIIDRQGLEHLLDPLVKYERQRWDSASEEDLPLLLNEIEVGDTVFVSIREITETTTPMLELERYPKVQGAVLVRQNGMIRAMVGGMSNRYYNRAVNARRLMGSTFKPFLFAAAMQLGWSPTDVLDNRRNVFVFMDRPYFPRPDHHSPHDFVSMSWAGVHSENVAAVWLLYHLLDQLTPPRLRELAAHLDMAPRQEEGQQEGYEHFKQRIRDRFGIRIDSEILAQAAYERAVRNLEADFLFEDRADDYQRLKALPYGLHFAVYRQEVLDALDEPDLQNDERKELRFRLSLLGKNFLALQGTAAALEEQRRAIRDRAGRSGLFAMFSSQPVAESRGVFVENNHGAVIFTLQQRLPDSWQVLHAEELIRRLDGLEAEQQEAFWGAVLLEDSLRYRDYLLVRRQLARELAELKKARPYSMETLAAVHDYRIMLGLQYLRALGNEAGIRSKLEPVLSFPLGSNVITLAEGVQLYETLITGNRHEPTWLTGMSADVEEDVDHTGLAIIERIESPEGKVIYAEETVTTPVLDQRVSRAVDNILQNVVLHGTGRYAGKYVRLHSKDEKKEKQLQETDLVYPLLGKTGTANQFRNAAFFGYVPVSMQEGETSLTLTDGYTVGVYVGYDNNVPMIRKTTHITGSTGALPIWCSVANAILSKEELAEQLDPVDLSFSGLGLDYGDTGHVFVPVLPERGGIVRDSAPVVRGGVPPHGPSILFYGRLSPGRHFDAERFFLPFWKNYGAIRVSRLQYLPPRQTETIAEQENPPSGQIHGENSGSVQ